MDKDFVYVDKDKCLLNVPYSILEHFGVKTERSPLPKEMTSNINDASKLVLFLIDGFGQNILDQTANSHFFKTFKERGKINKITSCFPATTAASISTLHTGLSSIEHGFFEWYLYMPSIEEIIESLPYKTVNTEFSNISTHLPQDSSLIYGGKTIYEKLSKVGVKSKIFLPEEIKESIYTSAISKGARVIGCRSLEDMLSQLILNLQDPDSKSYYYVYWPNIDKAEHIYGVWSEQAKNEIENFSLHLETDFLKKLSPELAKKVGIFFTADHGLENIDLENVTLLNKHDYITERYELNSKGNPILPTGCPRDIFLHIQPDKISEVISYLENLLKDKYLVLKLNDENISKLFGNFTPHEEFLKRLGNILILSKGQHVCWYEYNTEKKLKFKAHHGSLLPSEMIIPFGSAKASDLI